MGLRKLGEDTNVTKMKIVPMSEKQDATRSVVSSALDSPAVNEAMVGGLHRDSRRGINALFRRGAHGYIAAQSES